MTHPPAEDARTVVILGATGRTGKHLVRYSLDAGLSVVAIVRDPLRLGIVHERLRVETADVADTGSLKPLLGEADAVISALGSTGRPVCEAAMSAVLEALGAAPSPRVLAISAQPVAAEDDGPAWWVRLFLRPVIRWVFRDEYADLARMEDILRKSSATWSVLRPPYLTDHPPAGGYRLREDASPPGRSSMTRADLALALLGILDDSSTHRRALGIVSP